MTLPSLLLFLLGTTASLTLAAPQPADPAPTASANAPPIPEESAKSIFENGNHLTHPDIVPHLVPLRPTFGAPPPPKPSGITKPTVSHVKLPQETTPVVNTPGVPNAGNVLVGLNHSIPLSQISHDNIFSTLIHNATLDKRQTCPFPNCCPDPRFLSESTSFPYSVMGRWQNPSASCSATLVGPRHVLTASHCIDWNGANSWTGTISFSPQLWPGHNIGTYSSSLLIRYDETPEGGVTTDFNIAFDYVVAVLDEYPNLGWLGSKTYNTGWNNLNAWYQSGYAANAGGTQIPYAQGPFKTVGETGEDYQSDILEYTACGTPGDSGSSIFGWWSDGPYLIGLLTWQGNLPSGPTARDLWGPGGRNLPNLINVARNDHP